MKRIKKMIPIIQMLVIILCLPFLLAQDCQINQNLIQSLQDLISKKFTPASGQSNIYVTQLSFIDAKTRTIIAQPEEVELINKAVNDGIKRAQGTNPALKFNEQGHTIKNTDDNVNKLIDIIFDPGLTPNERSDKIIRDLMNPNGVDVIVTGSYVDDGGEKLAIKPMTIVKGSRKAVVKTVSLLKKDYICPDPANAAKKALCKDAHEEIAKAVKELLEAL